MKKMLIWLFLVGIVCAHASGQYQTVDNMMSTYRKDYTDGYSWRQRKNTYDMSQLDLTNEKLLSTIWVTDPFESVQTILVFYKDNVFNIGTRIDGIQISGKYIISNNTIVLSDYSYIESLPNKSGLMGSNTICPFLTNTSHLIYRDAIKINGVAYYAVGSEQPNGTEVIFKDLSVLVEKDTKVMSENMNFRTSPSVKGQLVEVYQYGEMTSKKITSLKKGTIVHLLARTKKIEKIDGVTSFWYYIQVYDGFEGFQYGWVFGGSFNDYDKSMESEYYKMLAEELKK